MPRKSSIAMPDYVFRVTSRGRPYYYYQRGRGTATAGPRIRLPDDPLSVEFARALRELSGQPPEPANPKSFAHLIERYLASPDFLQKRPSTRQQYQRHCRLFETWWGDLEVAGLTAAVILDYRDAMSDRPAEANAVLRSLSALLSWSVPRGYRADNPCQHVRKFKTGDGWQPWPWEMIEWARDNCPAWMWQAIGLAVYTGQRQGDVIAMQRSRRGDGMIEVRQEKTGRPLLIPVHRDLRTILDALPAVSTTYLTHNGRPWHLAAFRTAWKRNVPREITDAGLVFHGLRKSAVVTLLEAGCTTSEVQAITGQSIPMVEHYARQIDQARQARSAIIRWEEATK